MNEKIQGDITVAHFCPLPKRDTRHEMKPSTQGSNMLRTKSTQIDKIKDYYKYDDNGNKINTEKSHIPHLRKLLFSVQKKTNTRASRYTTNIILIIMPTKTINLNVEICNSGAIITDTDDGCKNAYSNESEACRSIANDIVCILEEMCDIHYRIKIDIIPIEE